MIEGCNVKIVKSLDVVPVARGAVAAVPCRAERAGVWKLHPAVLAVPLAQARAGGRRAGRGRYR